MKRKVLIISFIASITLSVYFFSQSNNNSSNLLLLDNIEAIANGETPGTYCIGSGNLDCRGYKVDYMSGSR